MGLSADQKKEVQGVVDARISAFAKKVEGLVDARVEAAKAEIAEQVRIDLLTAGVASTASDAPIALTDDLRRRALELAPAFYKEPVPDDSGEGVEHREFRDFRIVGDEIHADSSRQDQPGKWLVSRILDDAKGRKGG